MKRLFLLTCLVTGMGMVMAGEIITVNGRIDATEFGMALVHEHIMTDFAGAEKTGPHRWDPDEVVATMLPYMQQMKELGYSAFVDATPEYIGRDIRVLQEMSRRTGLHIVTNTGYYGAADSIFVPKHAYEETADELAARWVREFEYGIHGTPIRPGFIKTAVDPGPLSAIDEKLVRAAARAHLQTGLTIACHTGEAACAREVLRVVEEEGVSSTALILVHADGIEDKDVHLELARSGVWLEYDGIGIRPLDQVADLIVHMCRQNFAGQILLSHDAGWYEVGREKNTDETIRAFDSLTRRMLPELQKRNLPDSAIKQMLYANPAQAFSVSVRELEPQAIQDTKENRDERMEWWRQGRFGMFIHWGLYAVPAGVYKGEQIEGIGEWIMAWSEIPDSEYEPYAKRFNAVDFDAAEWVKIAKDAGMTYLVITSKHHDGFSMFDSAVTEYDIVDATPYGRDVMADLARECKRQGIKFCFYHSILDWHHPAQSVNLYKQAARNYPKTYIVPGRKDEYVAFMKAQLAELMDKYDPEVLWFDGEWVDWWTKEDGRLLAKFLWEMKPSLIINNRVGKRDPDDGDFGTPEQEIPEEGLDYDWETCMTINDTWGFKSWDHNWKSTQVLLENLVDIVSKGGNFLLNVGPTKEGVIPEESVVRLREMGQWLKINGEAVYGCGMAQVHRPDWGRYTQNGDMLYACVFDWPQDGTLEIAGLSRRIAKAELLTDSGSREVEVTCGGEPMVVKVGNKPSDWPIHVVALKLR